MEFSFKLDLFQYCEVYLRDAGLGSNDCRYALTRIKNEGVRFLTVAFPKFAKAVLHGIASGQFVTDRSQLSEFAWKGSLPRFMRRFLLGIFDQHGRVRQDADAHSLYVIRQVCEYFYKLALPFDQRCLDEAEKRFIETDESLGTLPVYVPSLEEVRKNVEANYGFPRLEEILSSHRPRFGPGTFSASRRLCQQAFKRTEGTTTSIPREYRGIAGYFKSYPASGELFRFGADTAEVSELLFVPKDSRGPRVIIREPLHRLRLQMAFFDWFSRFLEVNTKGRVNFQDQQVNRELARIGSVNGKWATIDLKDASDRVSLKVIRQVCRNIPALRYFIKHRTSHVLLPSGKTVELNKLAGMGSGLTFAMMAFLIHAVISTALVYRYGSYAAASRNVYVYGDDIIVRTVDSRVAKAALEAVGLRVNNEKSYTNMTGPFFRESCGGDYMNGEDVAPLRMRLPGATLVASGSTITLTGHGSVLAIERHCRELVKTGLVKSAEFLYSLVEKLVGPLPKVRDGSNALGRLDLSSSPSTWYEPLPTGVYPKVAAYVPYPVRKELTAPNVYHYLGRTLGREEINPLEFLFPAVGSTGTTYEEPRKVQLRRRRVSAFALINESRL